MGRRGPLPKPTALKRLEGNPGRRKLAKNEPTPAKGRRCPTPPSYLDSRAKEAWKKLAESLYEIDLLTKVDLHALEAYCVAYSQWRRMLAEVEGEAGFIHQYIDAETQELKQAQPTAEVSLMLRFAAEMNRWAKVLGLGPAYRVGMTRPEAGKGSDADDLLDGFGGG